MLRFWRLIISMDDEIDLRPWLLAVLRRWRFVISMALVLALLAASVAIIRPRADQVTAQILILPGGSEVSLDERFTSRDATLSTNVIARNDALTTLALSSEMVQRVARELGVELETSEDVTELLKQIEVEANGDLITITASGEDEAEALGLAEAWARNFERLVLETYSRDALLTRLVDEQLAVAEANLATQQATLEEFLAQSRVYEIDRQQKTLQGLVDGSLDAERSLYSAYAQRTREIEVILQDARTVREQLQAGLTDELASSLALLSLRARSSSTSSLPLQLLVDDVAAITNTPTTVAELDRLIAAMEGQRTRFATELERMALVIRSGETGLVGLDTATIQQYQTQLAGLRSEYEQLRAQERQLIQRRDTALSSVNLLRTKLEEQRIAELTSQLSVRVISLMPETPRSLLVSLILFGGAGLVLGTMGGIFVALSQEAVLRLRQSMVTAPPATPAPVTRREPVTKS
ncbi:hypothetical protein CJ255_07945 [Candidatus Viridilinea mediisalina]|uniref:Polysaccharide chain length determinant N-terminal domain-containing protein n=2 Tax=Candidatus Viridilinea mediisalina TaxID=2024553 RepID=A0A2A6RL02_9CHLR|nr:hypothetical protein CJ255_07945 [Candidatus Viridilinea mediisalina]